MDIQTTNEPYLSNKSKLSKIFVFLGILLLSLSVFSLISLALLKPLFGISALSIATIEDQMDNHDVLRALEFLQIMQAFGLFIIPTFLLGYLSDRNPLSFLKLSKGVALNSLLAVVLIMIAGQPLINFLVEWNSRMILPSFLHGIEQWMRMAEDQATKITESFLNMNSTMDFLIVLFMIAILPAIGEELLFRGVIQRLIKESTGKKHVAIFITALLFSAIHMQFYGFVPRFLLGLFLGYMLEWSGSLWLPITAHFVNNGMAVVLSFLSKKGLLSFDPDKIGTGENSRMTIVMGLLIVSALTFYIYHNRIKEAPLNSN